MSPTRIVLAAIVYFGFVFGAGFALGAVRVVLLQPYLGANLSRPAELPLMIGISYLAAQVVTQRMGPGTRDQWFKVGLMAFILLMGAEFLLGTLVFRTPLSALLNDMITLTGFLSLLAQALIILFPALAAGWDRTRS